MMNFKVIYQSTKEREQETFDDCDFCSECVDCCSGKALTIVDNQIQFQADKCTNCEVCNDVCPVGAIWIETLGMRSCLK